MPAATSLAYPPIPYGMADWRAIRREGFLYVDKSRFVRELECERHVFFFRPRRFGKSCWVSLLENYYERSRQDAFEAVFDGLEIGERPTANRSRYAVLRFNFSAFDDRLETLEKRFQDYCLIKVRGTLERNADVFPEEARKRILSFPQVDGKLNALFEFAGENGVPLYILIDEYDHFANTILAHEGVGAYHSVTHGGGFLRNFFATLKAGSESGGLERLFITGVSPVTMDDVTSGFNIGANVSFHKQFNAMAGFTEAEVGELLRQYRRLGVFDQDVDEALELMREWYDGYRFAKNATEDVYNTDMVLYYLKHSIPNDAGPERLIDDNVRIDYGKLRHLLVTNREASVAAAVAPSQQDAPPDVSNHAPTQGAGALSLNGNFDLLRHVIAEGRVDSELVHSFPVERIGERENFVTLLHCFGLLSIRGMAGGRPRLAIPNQTVRRLLYGYLRDAYRDVCTFSVDMFAFDQLMWAMGCHGEWRPAVEFLAAAVQRQTSVRSYIDGERMLQGFLAAYLGACSHFVFHAETELGKGYADLVLEPLTARYPAVRHGYVIELKYLRRTASAAQVEALAEEARAQLQRYLADEQLRLQHPTVRFTGVALVFRGWELAYGEQVAGT